MSRSLLVHDARLCGGAPSVPFPVYTVNQQTPLLHALNYIAGHAPLNNLYIMCHGYESGVDFADTQTCELVLGFGLCFCKEGLTSTNVAQTILLSGLIDVITLYACGPANTRHGLEGTSGDGARFCSELAAYTNAEVVAAVNTQYYNRKGGTANKCDGRIDFGNWEGPVYRFSPDGVKTRDFLSALQPEPV